MLLVITGGGECHHGNKMESNFISANRAFCVNGNPDSNPRLGVPGSAKATVSLGVSQRSRGRGLRGAARKIGAYVRNAP